MFKGLIHFRTMPRDKYSVSTPVVTRGESPFARVT
jgi:hypothetical protein